MKRLKEKLRINTFEVLWTMSFFLKELYFYNLYCMKCDKAELDLNFIESLIIGFMCEHFRKHEGGRGGGGDGETSLDMTPPLL